MKPFWLTFQSLVLILGISCTAYSSNLDHTFPAIVGELKTSPVQAGETLMDIALRERLGYDLIANSNRRIDPWNPSEGEIVLLPFKSILPAGAKPGININLAELRLFHIMQQPNELWTVNTYALGVGRDGRETPEGEFQIVIKKEQPDWRVPDGLRESDPSLPRIVPPGPENPLGAHWMGISAPGYGIHGTNRPYGVGRRISYGCLRMYPQDVAKLFDLVEPGTPVVISYQPVKAAWDGDQLFLEVHPDYLQRIEHPFQHALTVISRTGWPGEIDYSRVKEVVSEQRSWPQIIGRK